MLQLSTCELMQDFHNLFKLLLTEISPAVSAQVWPIVHFYPSVFSIF